MIRGKTILVNYTISLFFILVVVLGSFSSEALAVNQQQQDKLIEKISRDFTKKFCNAIAFGLSKDSAMDFANKENNLIFKNKKYVDTLSQDLIANEIAISVIDGCGYVINMKGEKAIKDFRNNYIILNKIIDN